MRDVRHACEVVRILVIGIVQTTFCSLRDLPAHDLRDDRWTFTRLCHHVFQSGWRLSRSSTVRVPVVRPPISAVAMVVSAFRSRTLLRVLKSVSDVVDGCAGTMAPGLGVREVATMLGVGEVTARTHLQHISSNTGTSKQTEVLKLLRSAAPPVKLNKATRHRFLLRLLNKHMTSRPSARGMMPLTIKNVAPSCSAFQSHALQPRS